MEKLFPEINGGVFEKLQAISYFQEENIIEIANNTLSEGIKCYEERNGTKYLELWGYVKAR